MLVRRGFWCFNRLVRRDLPSLLVLPSLRLSYYKKKISNQPGGILASEEKGSLIFENFYASGEMTTWKGNERERGNDGSDWRSGEKLRF